MVSQLAPEFTGKPPCGGSPSPVSRLRLQCPGLGKGETAGYRTSLRSPRLLAAVSNPVAVGAFLLLGCISASSNAELRGFGGSDLATQVRIPRWEEWSM